MYNNESYKNLLYRNHFHFKHHGRLLKVKMANMLYINAKSSVFIHDYFSNLFNTFKILFNIF